MKKNSVTTLIIVPVVVSILLPPIGFFRPPKSLSYFHSIKHYRSTKKTPERVINIELKFAAVADDTLLAFYITIISNLITYSPYLSSYT
ncbi:hypothetical protein DN068_07580 [Taibaiella soli]|uniref:Uncharacterized protein n=1 Tax=Taibaiella soli TaxID=1649169 RepID=A0A2W2AZW4_9BACT|nr:hypothetical protein DN068_07580 [Taibaiella soli]